MKKAIIALAVAAGSIAAAQADTTTLYGQIGYGADFDFGNLSDDKVEVSKSLTEGLNNSGIIKTKLGVKGEEDLGSGVAAFFNYEFKIDPQGTGINETKKAYVGFKGDFGKVTLGVQDKVWGDYVGKANYFNQDDVFGGYAEVNYDFYNGVRYDAPEMSGVKASLSYDLKGKTAEVGLGYNLEGVDLGAALQYNVGGFNDSMGNRSVNDKSHYRVGVSGEYAADAFKVAADYQFKPESVKDAKDDVHVVGLGASYNVTADSALYGLMQFRADEFSKAGQKYGLGYQYDLSKRTRTWVEAGLYHKGESVKGAKDDMNNFQMSVGVRHKF